MTFPLRALKPVIMKELRQVRRDPTSLGMLMVLPAAMIILVGYALNFDVKHTPLVIYDQDRTPGSRAFLEKFTTTEYFDYRYNAAAYTEVEELFLHGRAKIAVVVPASFAAHLAAGEDVHVQILVDGSDANTAGQALGTATRLTTDYATHLVADAFALRGRSLPVPVDFQPRVWYNPDLISSKFLVPGLIGFIIVLTAVISTSLTVVREKERGTMEQLMVSPLRPFEIILGKTIPYLGISLVAATAILILGYLLFGVEVRGSILLLYAAIMMIILGGLGQGLLISTVTDSQQVAFMISVFSSLLPSFLLSGFIFPVATMPLVLRIVSNLAVNKFFLVVVRGVMLKGVGLGAVWEQFVFMAAFAAVTLGVSARRMQKRSA
ncbi:MAG TPA: ABC transporter permease [Bacteroidota bacterium]|nr:ABC transporter permease [Bacteroidota bacterium]